MPLQLLACAALFWHLANPAQLPPSTSFDGRAVVRSPEGALVHAYLTRLEAFGFQGAVLVAKGGEVALESGYGLADEVTGRRNTADTAFLVASVAKPLVSLSVLMLESDGRLSIDDPLHVHFDVPPDKADITLRQVLSHTSGLDDAYRDLSPDLDDQEFLRATLKMPLVAEPGTRFSYSNFGYDLLRDLVARTSGATWEEFLRDEVFAHAGMDRSGFDLPDWSEIEVARYQDRGPEGLERYPANPLDVTEAHVSILSTVGDLHRLHRALDAGGLLPHEAQRRAYAEVRDGYALGWRTARTARGTRVLYHGGYDTAYGVVSGLYRYVDEDVVIVFLANTLMGGMLQGDYLARELEALVFGGSALLPPAVTELDADGAEQVVGTYELPAGEAGKGTIEVAPSPGGLVARSADGRGILCLLFPDASVPDGPRGIDQDLAHLFDGDLLDGDPADLEAWLWAGTPVEGVRSMLSAARSRMVSRHGRYLGCRTLHTRFFEHRGEPETHVYVLLEFERGFEVFRALRNAEGRWWLDSVERPDQVELALAPTGDAEYRTWSPRLGSSSRIRFLPAGEGQPARLELSGHRASIVLTRR